MRSPEVDAWFAEYDNPQKDVLLQMREAILGSDERISESIKWKSPTFEYEGNIAKVADLDEAEALEPELLAIFAAWTEMKDAE